MVEGLRLQSSNAFSCANGIDILQATNTYPCSEANERGQQLLDQYRRSPDAAEHLADQMQRKLNELEAELETAVQAENDTQRLTELTKQQQCQSLAEYPLKQARRHGLFGVAQTRLGLLHLYYNASEQLCCARGIAPIN